jgi:hypothetical protein
MNKLSHYLKFFIIVFLIGSAFPTMGSTYMQTGIFLYVDGSIGSDSNNGSSTTSAFKTIQKAASTAQPGTTIYVRNGTYNENIVVSRSGTQSAPITLTPYPGDTVVINGNGNIAIRNSGAIAYWVIDGLTIKSTNQYTLRLGWWGEPMTDHWTVRNNKLFGANFIMGSYHLWENNNIDGTGYAGTGGDGGISDGGDSHHNIYRGNFIHDFTHYNARGIWTQGKTHDSIIENNVVTNIVASNKLSQCIDLDGAAEVEWRHTVRGNIVSNCSYVGIELENLFDSIVENNVIIGGTSGIIIINYDASYGCKVGGENNQYGDTNGDGDCQGDITNTILRQNLITTNTNWGGGYGGIINWYVGGVKIWGNTISASSGAGNGGINIQGTLQQTKGGSIKGNIVTQGSGPAICATDLASIVEDSNNVVYRTNNGKPYAMGGGCNTGYSLAEYQAMSGKGTNSISANPLFVNSGSSDFHLTSSSPAIDSGINVNSSSDIEGSIRPVNLTYDAGAYEFGGTPVKVSPTSTLAPTILPTQTSGNNLALGKPAMQASVYGGYDASRAVDGNIDGVLANNSVTHTLRDAPQAWWQVDLGAISQIQAINVYNRTDCCSERALDVYVLVSDTPFVSTSLDATRSQIGVSSYLISGIVGSPSVVNVNRSGRYVRVQLTGTEFLSLAEVQVFGATTTTTPNTPTATLASTVMPTQTSGNNLALGKPATQVSLYESADASRAVDGNIDGIYTNNSVTHTLRDAPQAWWQVDLGAVSQIQTINIYNRTDCCSERALNVYVLVSDTPFTSTVLDTTRSQVGVSSYYISGIVGSPSVVNINRTGRYVRVQLTGTEFLSLAEVQVFGSMNPTSLPTSTVFVTNTPPPTVAPTFTPTNTPTIAPTVPPTNAPTNTATSVPTIPPTIAPTIAPTIPPTAAPTIAPTIAPTNTPTNVPTATQILNTPVATSIVYNSPTQTPGNNLARGKPAKQSSTYQRADASRAVDGNTDGRFSWKSVTHTNANTQAWWQVDLTAISQIQSINVWARTDCCQWRSNNVYVLVSDVPFSSTNLDIARKQAGVSSYYIAGNVGRPSTVDVNRTGRYVRVQLTGRDYLSLAEVEVFGGNATVESLAKVASPITAPTSIPTLTTMPTNTPVTISKTVPTNFPTSEPTLIPSPLPTQIELETAIRNLAKGKTATQVDIYEGYDAARAVDGNIDGNLANNSVTHTLRNAPQAWWQVDLGDVSRIQTINIYNRTDCCSERAINVFVLVSDTPFESTSLDATRTQPGVSGFYISGIVGSPSIVNVNRTGRYVRVQLTGTEFLSLAEVEVMGEPGAVQPTPIIIEPTAIPEATSTLMPTSEPVITDVPVLPTDIPLPTSTSIPLDPTNLPTFEPTIIQ